MDECRIRERKGGNLLCSLCFVVKSNEQSDCSMDFTMKLSQQMSRGTKLEFSGGVPPPVFQVAHDSENGRSVDRPSSARPGEH